jgi:cytochrome P450
MVSRIQQSLSFHDSPESFISSRLQQLSVSDPASLPQRGDRSQAIVRAAILNRNVHIISSYRLCKVVLEDHVPDRSENGDGSIADPNAEDESRSSRPPTFAAEPAYKQFMSAFFPGPNVLLQDGPEHRVNKERWKAKMSQVLSDRGELESLVRKVTMDNLVKPLLRHPARGTPKTTTIDLYNAMKALAWDLLFGFFLGLDRDEHTAEFDNVEVLQENLLRGQFSLFPVSVRTPFWSSPRTKGLDAVQKLQRLLATRLKYVGGSDRVAQTRNTSSCPFLQHKRTGEIVSNDEQEFDEEDMVAHLLVFTSSIANKALASLLTAFFLNLFLWRDQNIETASLAEMIRSQQVEETKHKILESVLAETERLSPPVVGVMRRVENDVVLDAAGDKGGDDDSSEHLISNGHDAWLYLAGASRDPQAFENAGRFVWDRYMSSDEKHDRGYAFGGGVKTCLGVDLARQMCLTVAKVVLESGLSFSGTVSDLGVRHWLGWQEDVPVAAIARDLKQLPCQRPRNPVLADVVIAG